MTMTDHEQERLIRLSEGQATLMLEVDHVKDQMGKIQKSLDDVLRYLRGTTKEINGIMRQNDRHEEKLAMLQELTASLAEAGEKIERSCKRLRYMLFGFFAVLIALAVLVGVLGEEVMPKILKWLWALVGL